VTGAGGGPDMTCPSCKGQMTREGAGVACRACGLFMGPGGAGSGGGGRASGGAGGDGGSGWMPVSYLDLTKMTMPPNPLFQEMPTIKKGDRVGFQKGDVLYVGVVAYLDTNEISGEVNIRLEDDSTLEVDGDA
jgi:hypothetical protein